MMLTGTGTLTRIADTLAALPVQFQTEQRRAALFAALEASETPDDAERMRTWDQVRCYATPIDGRYTPLYAIMSPPFHRDPYADGAELPTFGALMAALNYAAGAAN